jgi:hypothetical protein
MPTIHFIELDNGMVSRIYPTKMAAMKHLKECRINGTIFSVNAEITKHRTRKKSNRDTDFRAMIK